MRVVRTILVAVVLARSAAAGQPPLDEFFIISSVNPDKQQVVVKRPTEVTQVMPVSGETKYFDRARKPIALADLRAGDTVYLRVKAGAGGPVVVEVREGPMTISELHRRYFQKQD